jgi:hypothetical protein
MKVPWIRSVVVVFAMVMWGSLLGLGQNKQLYVGPPTSCSATITGPREAQWNIDGWWEGPGCSSLHSTNASCGQTPDTGCGKDNAGNPTGVSVYETNCGTCNATTYMLNPITMSPSCGTCISNCARWNTISSPECGCPVCPPGQHCSRMRKPRRILDEPPLEVESSKKEGD